jgi:hypothetical protein
MMLVACVRALNLLPPKLFCRKIDYLRRHAIICANGFRDGPATEHSPRKAQQQHKSKPQLSISGNRQVDISLHYLTCYTLKYWHIAI